MPATVTAVGPANLSRERRAHPRFPLRAPAVLRTIQASGRATEVRRAVIANVGNGGIRVRTTHPIPEGTLTDFTFRLPGRTHPTRLLGLVRWSRPRRGAGIEFFYSTDVERNRIIRSLAALERTGVLGAPI